MKRLIAVLLVSLMPALAFADAGMDAGTDAGSDAGSDAGQLDAGQLDAGQVDAGGEDAGPVVIPRYTVSGTAVLSTSEAASVEVVLMSDGTTPVTDFTDAAGRFEFRDIEPGTYDLTASYPEFVTQSRTIEVVGDRRVSFVLFPDVTFQVLVDVTFVEGEGPVVVTARSLGREVVTEGDGSGEIAFELGAGPWQVDVTSDDYVPANLSFSLAADRPSDEPVRVVAVLERPSAPEVTSDAGCSCSQTKPLPDASFLALLAFVALTIVRRRVRP